MRVRLRVGCALVALGIGIVVASAGGAQNDLVVHEWGTFLSMNGSDGITLDGMYHEEHALPAFVHSRSRDMLRLPSSQVKSETPVIYFYTQQPQRVQVTVGYPQGIWTQWYPQASLVGPAAVRIGSPLSLRDGTIMWNVNVTPSPGSGPLPSAGGGSLWNHARDVDAAFVSATDSTRAGRPEEWERFVFYRGLGQASLPFTVDVEGTRLSMATTLPEGVRHVYVLRVQDGRGVFRYLPSVHAGATELMLPSMDEARPMAEFSSAIGRDLEARLADSGLFAKEARAMVNTWRESYFQTDGVRVLFVLPQSWTNAYIPLRIHPAPRETVRVMVGRVEVLTPEREREAERAVLSLSSNDPSARERAFSHLLNQGRYVEPVLRRAIATSSDARVQSLVRRLLSTDFVKEIRATAARADDLEAPMTAAYQRAQLAALLRDVGLETEAKQEGERALAVLAKLPPPDLSAHASRHTLRALARANEGAGRYTDALRWYGDFVSFGSRSTLASCSGCHAIDGPQTMSYFRDWWAGRRYAQLAKRTGIDMRLVQDQLAALKSAPQDRAAQMRLAYLYEARGESAKAGRLWSEIDPGGDVERTPAP